MRKWLPFIAALFLMSCDELPGDNVTANGIYYSEKTGHSVRDEILYFYEIYGGVDSLGHPLTEEIIVDGWTMQYFEMGRLELHPENEPAYRVTVGWLGDLLHRRRPPIPPASIPGADGQNRRYFPETGHTVSGDFWRYFGQHGGSVRFGLPISEPFLHEGRLTQDFQSARFFWTPEKPIRVTLEEIGRVHFEESGLDDSWLYPVLPPLDTQTQ